MQVTLHELETDAHRIIDLTAEQEVLVTEHGEPVARIISARPDKAQAIRSLFGLIPNDTTLDEAKADRLT
jgi:prevent-host-death family protein